MHPLLILAAVGAGGYWLLTRSGSSGLASAQAQAAAQANASAQSAAAGYGNPYDQAQAFNAQANALGLSQADAQQAYDIGLSPQEYVDAGLKGSAG